MEAVTPSSHFIRSRSALGADTLRTGGVFALSLICGAIGAFVAFVAFDRPATGIDDADIFFVYAKHLAEGHGFVYNVGGERVEGFSSLLWTLILAPAFWVTSRPELLLVVVNLLMISAALTALVLFVDRHLAPRLRPSDAKSSALLLSFPSLAVIVWTFAAPGYISWTALTLMETGLWSALLIAATVLTLTLCLRPNPSYIRGAVLSVIIALLVLTRPEAILWGLVFAGFYFLTVLRQTGNIRTALKHLLLPLSIYGATIGGLTLFRLAYFGYPLPNTYYAKVSPDLLYNLVGGTKYLFNFVSSNGFVLVGVLAALGGVLRFANNVRRKRTGALVRGSGFDLAYLHVSVVILVGAVIPVLVGGDHFDEHRFYQPLWLLLPIAALFGLAYVYEPLGLEHPVAALRPFRYLLLAPLFLLFSWSNEQKWHELEEGGLIGQFGVAESGRAKGEHLNAFFASLPAPEVGVIAAGGVKLTYAGPINDLLGLNNVAMAHGGGDRRGYTGHVGFEQEVLYAHYPRSCCPTRPAET